MHRRLLSIVCLCSALIWLAACSGAAAPTMAPTDAPTLAPTDAPTDAPTGALTPEPTSTATATSLPSSTPKPTLTSTATSTPAPTATFTPTAAPTAAPTRSASATPKPVVDPLTDRQTFAAAAGVSIAYPGTWQPADKGTSFTIGSPDLAASGRATGAELIVVVGPWPGESSLPDYWAKTTSAFPKVTYGEAAAIKLDGEDALRALFSDSSDGSHGWFMLAKHNGLAYIVVMQAIPNDNWANYQTIFSAMLKTFRFTK